VLHEPSAVRALGFVLVVSRAPEPEVRDRRLSTACHGDGVIELKELALLATTAFVVDMRTLVAVPPANGAADVCGDVPRVLGSLLRPHRGSIRRAIPALLELQDQRVERAVEDFGDVA